MIQNPTASEMTEDEVKEDNRYAMVNSVAKRAKKILSQNEQRGISVQEISHHRAIHDAIEQLEKDDADKE